MKKLTVNCAAVSFLKDGYIQQQHAYFNNKKLITTTKMLFQLFFCAAEQWHPVAIRTKILANSTLQTPISVQRKMKRIRN